ncbi:hypothetical protein Tco_0967744 [Tanacetum coccineum]
MYTFPSRVFEFAQRSFDVDLCSALERIVTNPRHGDVLNYVFLAPRLLYVGLQTKLLRHVGIVASGPIFDNAFMRLGVPLFSLSKLCSACSRDFVGDIYEDHVVLCAGILGHDKPLRPTDMLLYTWDKGLDVCVDLIGTSPLTQTRMTDFVVGRTVVDAAQRKRV